MKTKEQQRRFLVGIFMMTLTAFLSSCDPTDTGSSNGSNVMLSSCLTGTLQNGLISFYPFNSGNINDASGYGHDLENPTAAMASADRFGNPACAYYFGYDDYLRDINPIYLNALNTFSISLWYKADSLGEPGAYRGMVRRDSLCINSTDNEIRWTIGTHDCSRPVFQYKEMVIWQETPPQFNDCYYLMDSLDNQWHHLVGIYDNGVEQLWLDGVSTSDVEGYVPCNNGTPGPLGDLLFGRKFVGALDDIAMYDRVLTPLEIQALFTLAPCCD